MDVSPIEKGFEKYDIQYKVRSTENNKMNRLEDRYFSSDSWTRVDGSSVHERQQTVSFEISQPSTIRLESRIKDLSQSQSPRQVAKEKLRTELLKLGASLHKEDPATLRVGLSGLYGYTLKITPTGKCSFFYEGFYTLWYRGPDSNRHGVATTRF